VLQMQAPINFVFPKISRPQSAGTNWELFQPSQMMPGDQGIHFSEAKPHIFSGAIEDRPDASFYFEPTLSLESPLPLTAYVQAHQWSVDSLFSAGDKNRMSFLMDQSSGHALENQVKDMPVDTV
jgi:hypothetical protein